MNKDKSTLVQGYKKDNVAEFLQLHNPISGKITVEDIYKAMLDLYAMKLNRRRIKVKIATSAYVANLLRQNQCNINIILCSAILNFISEKNKSEVLSNMSINTTNDMVVKLVNKEIYILLSVFLTTEHQYILSERIGELLHYYYIVKK